MNIRKMIGIGAAALLTLALLLGLGLSSGLLVAAQAVPHATSVDAVGDEPGGTTAPADPSSVMVDGKILATRADGFNVDGATGLINVTVTAQTQVAVGNAAPVAGAMSSLTTGMFVHVEGISPAGGQIVARLVRELGGANTAPAAPDQPHAARPTVPNHGLISAVDKVGVTVALDSGRTAQFQTTAATIVIKQGFATLAALQPGDEVQIATRLMMPHSAPTSTGDRPGDSDSAAAAGTPTALLIWVPQADEKFVQAMIEKVDGNTLLVSTGRGMVTVQLDSATYQRLANVDSALAGATQSEAAVNTPVLLFGTSVAGQDRTLAAHTVVLLPVPPASPSRPAPLPGGKQP